jgi:NAD-dependent SIR2 family protein deacetylase
MWTPYKIFKYLLILLIIATSITCAPAKKNPFYENNSQVNASQLGRNKYYFSKDYQKKLQKRFKKR